MEKHDYNIFGCMVESLAKHLMSLGGRPTDVVISRPPIFPEYDRRVRTITLPSWDIFDADNKRGRMIDDLVFLLMWCTSDTKSSIEWTYLGFDEEGKRMVVFVLIQ